MPTDNKTQTKAVLLVLLGVALTATALAYTLTHTHVAAGADGTKAMAGLAMLAGSLVLFVGLVNLERRPR